MSHEIVERANALQSKLLEIRRKLHAQPELSFQEVQTSKLIAETLTALGYTVRTGVAGTGVVAEIGAGKTIILRADMDALPIQQVCNKPYASQVSGTMHACGHDAHVACALGAAMLIAQNPPTSGCVRFVFQPAEEAVNADGKSGATLMIEEGATTGADGVIALHVYPRLPAGHIGLRSGPLLAAADRFDITITGRGSHAAFPEYGIDSIALASLVVQSLQQVITRRKSALDAAVLSVAGIRSSTYASNVLPDQVEMTGVLRYFEPHVGSLLRDEITRACKLVELHGGSFDVKFITESPALTNDPAMTAMVRAVGKEVLGDDFVHDVQQEMGSDDFTYLAAHMPACYFLLGTYTGADQTAHHTPTFDIDEAALPVGSAMLAQIALHYLRPTVAPSTDATAGTGDAEAKQVNGVTTEPAPNSTTPAAPAQQTVAPDASGGGGKQST